MNSKIKNIAWELFKFVRNSISLLMPIDKDLVMFDSFPDYSDNSRAMSDYLSRHTTMKIIWAVSNENDFKSNDRIKFIGKNGLRNKLKYIFYSLKAKYLFSTHGAFLWSNPKHQIFTCIWHGTPLKRICRLQNPNSNIHFLENCNYFVSPSKDFQNIIARCFGRQDTDVLINGYPRNDFLFQFTDCLSKLGISSGGDKLIVYLPTFRKPKGGGYIDSSANTFSDGPIDFTNDTELELWNKKLKTLGVKLIVKPHPSDSAILNAKTFSNIIIVPHSQLTKYDIQLYNILHYADAIITDYSSVYCDYLSLDRPIGFLLTDYEDYAHGRGFVFDNPLEKLPGVKIFDKNGFEAFIEEISKGDDSSKQIRKQLTSLYIDDVNCNNCKSLWEKVQTK